MCGLVGAADTWLAAPEVKTYRALANFNYLRGIHSAGATICYQEFGKKGGHYVTNIHAMGHPATLAEKYPEYYDKSDMLRVDRKMRFVLGHSRHATIGNVNEDNAHPFKHGSIYGMHNGTLVDFDMRKEERWDDFETDSEWIMWHLSEYGVDATIPKLSGAYALIWFDLSDEKIYFIRNDERPLHYTEPTFGRCMFWSSDKDYLEMALKIGKKTIKDIHSFKVNTLYSYDTRPPSGKDKWADVFTEEKEIKGKSSPVYRTPYRAPKNLWNSGHNRGGTGTTHHTANTARKDNVVDLHRKKNNDALSVDLREHIGLVGKTFQFFVDPAKHQDGAFCSKIHPVDAEIPVGYIYALQKIRQHDIMNDTFTAKIKSVVPKCINGRWQAVITVDNRTVEVVKEKGKSEEAEVEMFRGFNGQPLTKQQYEKKLESKCANCSADEELGEANFFSFDEWLCNKCEAQGLSHEIPVNTLH